MGRIAAVSVILLCAFSPAQQIRAGEPQTVTITSVSRDGGVFEVESVSRIAATPDVAWQVLTDYEGYADFVPDMQISRRIGERPLRVEQKGVFRVLFLRKTVRSILEVEERVPDRIRFHAIEGNLRSLETQVEVFANDAQVIVNYRSRIEPGFWVPPLIGTPLLRAAIHHKLTAVAREIVRRAGLEARR